MVRYSPLLLFLLTLKPINANAVPHIVNELRLPINPAPSSCPTDFICLYAEEPIAGFKFLTALPSGGGNPEVVSGIGGQLFTLPFATGTAGDYFVYGFYDWNDTSTTLTQASPTVAFGSANQGHNAWAGVLPNAVGTADGDCDMTVIGTSWDAVTGTLTSNDRQILVNDVTTAVAGTRYDSNTLVTYVGAVTFELILNTGTTCSFGPFNYGLSREERADGSKAFFRRFEVQALAGANDSDFEVQILRSTTTNWTYAASGFVAGPTALFDSSTDLAPDDNLVNRKNWHWRRFTAINIDGALGEGLVVKITTGSNNAVDIGYLNLSTQFVGF